METKLNFMNENQRRTNLAQNLQYLCSRLGSVTEACRRFKVNRQQFNKYLSGKHQPSNRILFAISECFNIETGDLFRDRSDFQAVVQGASFSLPRKLAALPQFQHFTPFIAGASASLAPYYGVYYRYHNSSIYKGRILRSLVQLYENESLVQYVCIERFPRLDDTSKIAYTFKYHGFAFLIKDRLFLMDFEGIQRNEMTFSILIPQQRNVLRFLYGVVMGLAATALRAPFSTRLALDYQGPGPIRRSQLKSATTLLPSDRSIPLEVRGYLTGKNSTILWAEA
jgi:transcriptional regulator with XRE-family HTH domain